MSPYDELGVAPDASDEEIARAYKRLAKRYHPDLNPGDAAAAERMGRINRAYDDIKAMRQRGTWQDPAASRTGPGAGPAYWDPFDPFAAGRSYYEQRPRRSPIGMVLAVLVMIFVIRLMLSLMFGGFGGYYYFSPGFGGGPGGYYGYSQVFPGR